MAAVFIFISSELIVYSHAVRTDDQFWSGISFLYKAHCVAGRRLSHRTCILTYTIVK